MENRAVATAVVEKMARTLKWMSIAEQEPPAPGRYLACFHDGEMGVIQWPGQWKKRTPLNTLVRCDITHWMPLPEKP